MNGHQCIETLPTTAEEDARVQCTCRLWFRFGRVGGITITFILLIACAVTILARALAGT